MHYQPLLFYKDKNSISTRETIGKCIWKGDEFGNLNKEVLKIDSEVATDNDKEEFLEILRSGEVKEEYKSRYANIFRYFQSFLLIPSRLVQMIRQLSLLHFCMI